MRNEKEALAKKLKAMEGKILKGEARGGLAEVTKKKEAELQKREEELEKRYAARGWQHVVRWSAECATTAETVEAVMWLVALWLV